MTPIGCVRECSIFVCRDSGSGASGIKNWTNAVRPAPSSRLFFDTGCKVLTRVVG